MFTILTSPAKNRGFTVLIGNPLRDAGKPKGYRQRK